jgi:ABC-type phosphate transport system substrate-binding protein
MGTRAYNALHVLLAALAGIGGEVSAAGGVVVIGDARLAKLDVPTLEKVYTGKVIEVDGIPVTAVNASSGSSVRNRFLQNYLKQDEDRYTAYWTVRRYIGKGASPRELSTSAEVINFVRSTPGAIGYIDEAEVPPGVNVLLR